MVIFFQRNSMSAQRRPVHVTGPFRFDDTLTIFCKISGMTHYFWWIDTCIAFFVAFSGPLENIAETSKILCEKIQVVN